MKPKTLSYFAGVLLWIICVYEFALIALRGVQGRLEDIGIFGGLLTHGGAAERAAPIAVFVVLGWVMLEVFFHFRRTRREMMAARLLQAAASRAARRDLATALSQVAPESTRASNRAKLIRKHLSSPGYLHEAVPSSASLDDAEFGGQYNVTKTYVWILPVIGFMGTAWGMLNAIGGFSAALADTRDIGILADRLGQLVIPGLAHAFSITILALGSAIVAHFWVTVMQSREGDILDDINQSSLAILAGIPRVPADMTAVTQATENILAAVREIQRMIQMEEVIGNLTSVAAAVHQAATSLSRAAVETERSITVPYNITITRGEQP